MVPSEEEFAAWCEHPVTGFVAAAWLRAARAQRDAWTTSTWSDARITPEELERLRTELFTRADAYAAFLETGLNEYARLIEAA